MLNIRRSLSTVLSLFGSAAFAQGAVFSPLTPQQSDLADYKWSQRPVLIFAPDPQDSDFKDQLSELREAREGLAERDIVVLTDTDPDALGRLRTALAVDSFEIMLVGKDGGVKLRQDKPLTARALFDTIDAMPMRRREMAN